MKTNVILITILLFFSYGSSYSQISPKTIINEKPKYSADAIEFKLLYTIDLENDPKVPYYRPGFFADVDNNNYLYCCSPFDGNVIVYNDKGIFVRSLGQNGQGPTDLLYPESITITNDTLYIYEKDKGVKVWDKNGKYVKYLLPKIFNMMALFKNGNYYYSVETKLTKNNKVPDNYEENNLVQLNMDMSIRNKYKMFSRYTLKDFDSSRLQKFAFDTKGNIYLFEDKDKYLITKYDVNRKKLLTFGRKYKPEKLSKEIRDAREKKYKNNPRLKDYLKKEYPNVLNEIFIDNNDYIFVTVGVINSGSGLDKDIETIVDVFDTEGSYLYSFNTKIYRASSTIKNNRLYSYPAEYDLKFHVYEIKYNK